MAIAQAKPYNTARLLTWGLFAVVLIVAPMIFTSPFSRSMLAQIGIAIVACLSYNVLLGQGGMLSFGHAVYTGLGTFVAVHVMNSIGGGLPIPISLIPLVGGLAGIFFAVILGYVTTKKAGTPFAMITLGIGELVFAMSLMIPEFFGGEAGVSANRVVGSPVLGINYGSALQVYYLLAIYTFLCTAAMFAFTGTPLGRMLNAVRDNPERVEFIGYEMQRVRYLAFIISGFFAGVAGGMYAMNFEIATAEVVGAARSGAYLLFTFLGGATVFFGPIIGAVLMVLAFVLLSEFTKAWLLYLGLIFLFMVMFAPGGVAGLILINVRVIKFGKFGRLVLPYVGLLLTGALMVFGAAALIEMIYHIQLNMGMGSELHFFGLTLDVASTASWAGALAALLVGGGLFEIARRRFARQWNDVQTEIADEISRRHGGQEEAA
ncbi:MAG: branched-chain amino acid ABC transporter permease [Rubrivivax sp.]|nr:branched-chain amino acid ABC transporter permease [Rubrivivax sp.]